MPLVQLALSSTLLFAPQVPPPPVTTVRVVYQEPRGRIEWFRGSFEELLAESAQSERIVFLDFYSRSNPYSRKLEKTTYVAAPVLAQLEKVLCFSVDTDSKDSKPLRKRYQVQSSPALVFLDPDGNLRDHLSGYYGPERFTLELVRIQENRGTLSDLRARIAKDPGDLDARWAMACKLREVGDLFGSEAELAEIRERDREGNSLASRRIVLAELYARATASLDLEPLYAFVEKMKEPVLLFECWWKIWELEGQAARSASDLEEARRHELRYFAAARQLWPLVPKEQIGSIGNNIAWYIYESRASASRADLEFALSVAEKAVAASPDVPAVVDTLACCLFVLGKKEEALAQVRRCIELDPENPTWRERLAEFESQR
ncbi:MAG: thioredoxin family protein [Planctomycetota bacterium]